jgi:hypothetical protein
MPDENEVGAFRLADLPERAAEQRIAPCACGCGTPVESPDAQGRERRFVQSHTSRGVAA